MISERCDIETRMKILRTCKRAVERLIGARIYGHPSTIIQVVPEKKRRKAWFSYPSTIRAIIEEYKVDLILDVGANVGQFALAYAGCTKARLSPSSR